MQIHLSPCLYCKCPHLPCLQLPERGENWKNRGFQHFCFFIAKKVFAYKKKEWRSEDECFAQLDKTARLLLHIIPHTGANIFARKTHGWVFIYPQLFIHCWLKSNLFCILSFTWSKMTHLKMTLFANQISKKQELSLIQRTAVHSLQQGDGAAPHHIWVSLEVEIMLSQAENANLRGEVFRCHLESLGAL